MFFSEYYGIESSVVENYGAVDISFVCDIPLFIDPMLIFNSEKEEYKVLQLLLYHNRQGCMSDMQFTGERSPAYNGC